MSIPECINSMSIPECIIQWVSKSAATQLVSQNVSFNGCFRPHSHRDYTRANLVWEPNMYRPLIIPIYLRSSHQISCDGTQATWIYSLSDDQRYTFNSISCDQCRFKICEIMNIPECIMRWLLKWFRDDIEGTFSQLGMADFFVEDSNWKVSTTWAITICRSWDRCLVKKQIGSNLSRQFSRVKRF